MDTNVAKLDAKIRKWKPEAVCIVGKGIWESVWRVRHWRRIRKVEFRWSWQHEEENKGMDEDEGEGYTGARVYVTTSTNGFAASLKPPEKEAIWRQLGEWVMQRRVEKG